MSAPIRYTITQTVKKHCLLRAQEERGTRDAGLDDLRLALASLTPEERAEVLEGVDVSESQNAWPLACKLLEAERERDELRGKLEMAEKANKEHDDVLCQASELGARLTAEVAELRERLEEGYGYVNSAWKSSDAYMRERDAALARLAAYENGDDVDRVGRVVRAMAGWTAEARVGLAAQIAERWPETRAATECHHRVRAETAEGAMRFAERLAQEWQNRAEKAERDRDTAENRLCIVVADMREALGCARDDAGVDIFATARSALELRDAAIRDRDAAVKRAETAERQRDGHVCYDEHDCLAFPADYVGQIAALRADVARVARERDAALAAVERMRPVVKRACAACDEWDRSRPGAFDYTAEESLLYSAVRAYRAQKAGGEGAARCAPEPMTAEDALELKARRALDGWENGPHWLHRRVCKIVAGGLRAEDSRTDEVVNAPTHLALARELGLMGDDGPARGDGERKGGG
jgi:hypothetical protein